MTIGLTPTDCNELRAEIKRCYPRLMCRFVLEDYDQVIADVNHCRALIDLCDRYAERQADRRAVRGLVPYLVLVQAKAGIVRALHGGAVAEALFDADRGLHELLEHFCRNANVVAYEQADEVRALQKAYRLLFQWCKQCPSQGWQAPTARGHLVTLQNQVIEALTLDRTPEFDDAWRTADHAPDQAPLVGRRGWLREEYL